MSLEVKFALAVLGAHFFADFVVQTDSMAKNKSTSLYWLVAHVSVYSFVMLFFGPVFAILNGLAHMTIDFVTSRITSYLWKKGERHTFFIVIGLDQLLHTACLLSTLKFSWWYL